jgi:hypothetical protein
MGTAEQTFYPNVAGEQLIQAAANRHVRETSECAGHGSCRRKSDEPSHRGNKPSQCGAELQRKRANPPRATCHKKDNREREQTAGTVPGAPGEWKPGGHVGEHLMFPEAREHRGSELERVGDARGSVCFLARNDVKWHVSRAINSTTTGTVNPERRARISEGRFSEIPRVDGTL